jgi:hypothetical protein
MLRSLEISGFRTFRHLRVDGLARVNLVVGGNNAGKTSVLEACEILIAGGRPWVLLRSPTRRGDGFLPESRPTPRDVIDIRHLFHGHGLEAGVQFEIIGEGDRRRQVRCEIVPAPSDEGGAQTELLPGIQGWQAGVDLGSPLAVQISGDQAGDARVLRLGEGGVLPISLAARRAPADEDSDVPSNFVGTTDPEYRLNALWDQILLTPNEDRVAEALRIVQPSIDRVASLSRGGRGGPSPIVVRLRGSEARVPIGSMGDGLKRLLVLSVNLVTSAGGCLFVDEIDTGLHYSVIAQMWRLIIETASRLGVQVFASTHSLDCIQALAAVCEKSSPLGNEVAVHRVQDGTESTVRYSGEDVALAIRHEMEIR